ncbi:MAG: alpha/beta fold hydrolase [Alcanivoracaceae bacterium]
MTVDRWDLPVGGDYRVPVSWYPAARPRATIVLMAALGVGARFYQPLAVALQKADLNVALVEQRGHGDSALRPSRRVNFGFREALLQDIPAVLQAVAEQAPALPLYLMGHSLGGHYAAITAGRLPGRVDGVIITACGSPWVAAFDGVTRRQLKLLCRLIPLCNLVLGYYPGDRLGFGGREARRLMADWLALARTNVYQADGVEEDFEAGIAAFSGPLLSIRLADDPFAPERAMAAVSDKFNPHHVSKVVVTAAELGDRADHFRWARTPGAIVHHVNRWLVQQRL